MQNIFGLHKRREMSCPDKEVLDSYKGIPPGNQELNCRSQWTRGLRLRSAAALLLRLRVRIPPGAWMFVCCECCVLSGRDLCDGLITGPEESY